MAQGRGRRESGKHGPRLDDELAREQESLLRGPPLEAHVEEFKEKEEPVETGLGLPRDPVLARRELSRHLGGSVFPAHPPALIEAAQGNGAPEKVVALLERLPVDVEFGSVHELWAEVEQLGIVDPNEERVFEDQAEGRKARPPG
jgi:hypothetical protein